MVNKNYVKWLNLFLTVFLVQYPVQNAVDNDQLVSLTLITSFILISRGQYKLLFRNLRIVKGHSISP